MMSALPMEILSPVPALLFHCHEKVIQGDMLDIQTD
jgi:hypothetical protein